MFPKGFFICGKKTGISGNKNDMGLIYSSLPCRSAGAFTSNRVKAAPVTVSEAVLSKNPAGIRAVAANSGCANACTGKRGRLDAEKMCAITQKELGLGKNCVLVASTGVIGKCLPMQKAEKGLKALCREAYSGSKDEKGFAEAVMTTDTFPKTFSRSFGIGGKRVTVWGCAKGAGMIHPDLKLLHATMLGFILTDAAITSRALKKVFAASCEESFNCVSVDGDTSTNDSVFLLANGAAENPPINGSGPGYAQFRKALLSVCLGLAEMIARDGEGATKFIEISVVNAKKKSDAKAVARTIATSPLFKTAVFGEDANWGRILAAAGRAGVKLDPEKIAVKLGNMTLARNGCGTDFSEKKAAKLLKKKNISVTVDLNNGRESAKYMTCDFSLDYVKINADYRS